MNSLQWFNAKRKVKELIAYDKNPRKITNEAFELLKKSIDENGYAEVIAIDTDNTIIAGHMRAKALIALGRGDETIDVRVPNRKLTKKEFDRYLIQSNKVTGEWNWDLLANNFENSELLDWGFNESELGIDMGGSSNKEVDAGSLNGKSVVTFSFDASRYHAILEALERGKEKFEVDTNEDLLEKLLDDYV